MVKKLTTEAEILPMQEGLKGGRARPAKVGELVVFKHFHLGDTPQEIHWHITGQVPPVFLMSDRFIEQAYYEVRPLTLLSFLSGWARNIYRLWHWRIARLCWHVGLIDPPLNEPFSWRRYWRWCFWASPSACRKDSRERR